MRFPLGLLEYSSLTRCNPNKDNMGSRRAARRRGVGPRRTAGRPATDRARADRARPPAPLRAGTPARRAARLTRFPPDGITAAGGPMLEKPASRSSDGATTTQPDDRRAPQPPDRRHATMSGIPLESHYGP